MNQVVLITGATSGLGRKCADFLSRKGYQVYGTGRTVDFGEVLDSFTLIPCDVLIKESIKTAIDYIIKKEGRIDILINNAGRGMLGSAEDATIEESKLLFNLNFHGIERTCKEVLPYMRQQGSGKIINISSLAGIMGLPYRSLYSATKYALEGWSESLRMEVKQFGIHVSLVSPGDFISNIADNRIVSEKTRRSTYKKQFEKVSVKIDLDVDHGVDAMVIVRSIYKAVRSNQPKLRYIAASPLQKFAVHLHYLLPSSWYEKLIMKSSGL